MITHFDMSDGRVTEALDGDSIDAESVSYVTTAEPLAAQLRLLPVTEAIATQRSLEKVPGALLQLSFDRFEQF